METIVKYRFDKEMVSFVKKLDIKTAMFGYDKNDVYSKFKDLLIKARNVCEELVVEEYRTVEQMRAELIEAAGNPAKLEALLAKWNGEQKAPMAKASADAAGQEETSADAAGEEGLIDAIEIVSEGHADTEQLTGERPPEIAMETEEQREGAVAAAEAQEPSAVLLSEYESLVALVAEMELQLNELQTKLDFYKEREEELNRTADILREARLEGEAIVQAAQMRAEQELFLYRAKRRDEERAFQEVIDGLEAKKENLAETCAFYRSYIDEGHDLLNQLQEYSLRFAPPAADDSAADTAGGHSN